MQALHTLTRSSEYPKMRVGRGGKRGKTSGKGTKGQNSRAGRKKRPEIRDIIKKLPKRRGYGKNRGRTVDGTRPTAVAITLDRLNLVFESNTEVTPRAFLDKGVVKGRGKKFPPIKIVGIGEISKALNLKGVGASASARAAIEKAGGSVA